MLRMPRCGRLGSEMSYAGWVLFARHAAANQSDRNSARLLHLPILAFPSPNSAQKRMPHLKDPASPGRLGWEALPLLTGSTMPKSFVVSRVLKGHEFLRANDSSQINAELQPLRGVFLKLTFTISRIF